MTLETWISTRPYGEDAKAWLRELSRALLPADPGEVSLLHALFYVRSGGGLEKMIGTINSAQETRLSGGSQQLSTGLASQLDGRVMLGCPVNRLEYRSDEVVAYHDRGVVSARRAIVAIPPVLAGRIRYSPPMPGIRDQLTQRSFMGSVIKVHAVYDRPFWREAGLSGHATSDAGLVHVTFDQSHPDRGEGVIVGFIDSRHALSAARLPAEERRSAVIADLVRLFGDDAAGPTAYYERAWFEEEWSRGCYVGIMTPGTWSQLGSALREPVGPIHWAGTETATVWNGYMDGAIRSGEAAAEAVLNELTGAASAAMAVRA